MRAVPNRRVGELRSQGARGDNVLPASTYIKNRVDELKQDAEQLKDSHRKMASAIVRLDDMCFEEFGRIDQQLRRIDENIANIVEQQARSIQEIHDVMMEVLGRMRDGEEAHRPTVRWSLVPPNGEEPQGRGGSSSASGRQFDMNEDF